MTEGQACVVGVAPSAPTTPRMRSPGTGGRILVDISDLARFLMKSSEPTGIQRVEISLLRELLRRHGPSRIRGLLNHPVHERFFEVDLSFWSVEDGFLGDATARALGVPRLVGPSRGGAKRLTNSALKRAPGWLRERMAPPPPALRAATLGPDDVILILGLNLSADTHYPALRAAFPRPARVAHFVHDVLPLVRPQYFPTGADARFRAFLRRVLATSDQIVCNSENTARDLRRCGEEIAQPVAVVPLAHQFGDHPRRAPRAENTTRAEVSVDDLVAYDPSGARRSIPAEFALCVGTLEVRKNGVALLEAWSRLRRAGETPPTLVFAGRHGWKLEAFRARLGALEDEGVEVLFVDQPRDAELARLYAAARFTVFPSLYEGWGLPVGESLWFGAPCLASNAASIPEVGGDLTTYFDPTDPDAIARSVSTHLASDAERLRAHLARAPLRAWSDVAAELYDAILPPDGDLAGDLAGDPAGDLAGELSDALADANAHALGAASLSK